MAWDPTIDRLPTLRRKTETPLLTYYGVLRDPSRAVREKMLLAARAYQGTRFLRDPNQDDPALAAAVPV